MECINVNPSSISVELILAVVISISWFPMNSGVSEFVQVCMYVCMGAYMALITALILCARPQDSLLSVSVLRVHVVLSASGFSGGGNPCQKGTFPP